MHSSVLYFWASTLPSPYEDSVVVIESSDGQLEFAAGVKVEFIVNGNYVLSELGTNSDGLKDLALTVNGFAFN